MSRLEGKQPNAGAIIIGAIIFSLVAAGLFFAFRPVPEPTDAGLNNSAPAIESSAPESETNSTKESENSLTMILTPLPEATPSVTPSVTPTEATVTPPNVATPSVTPTANIKQAATPTNERPTISPDSVIKPEATAPVR